MYSDKKQANAKTQPMQNFDKSYRTAARHEQDEPVHPRDSDGEQLTVRMVLISLVQFVLIISSCF